MPRRWPKRLALGIALLVAGAITQTFVAWTCDYLTQRAAIGGQRSSTYERWMLHPPPSLEWRLELLRTERFGSARVRYGRPTEDFARVSRSGPLRPDPTVHAWFGYRYPPTLLAATRPLHLTQLSTAFVDEQAFKEYFHTHGNEPTVWSFAGWPWLSLYRVDHRAWLGPTTSTSTLHLHVGLSVIESNFMNTMQGLPQRRVPIDAWPIGIVWPNALANTAIYTLAWAVLAVVPCRAVHYLRRWYRLRGHLCPTCGYDSRNLPACPECGRPAATPR